MRCAASRRTAAALIIAIAAIAAFAVVACGTSTLSVRGIVVEVRAGDIIEWESIVVRAEDGRELEFDRGATVDLRFWRASHLREHMNLGLPVIVEYEDVNGTLVARTIGD